MKFILSLSFFIAIIALGCRTETYQNGEALYKSQCATCHMDNGMGLGELIPPVAASDYLKNNRKKLACIIKKGLEEPIVVNGKVYNDQKMPANDKLKPADIANILNYIGTHFNNQEKIFTIEEINEQLKDCE